MSPKSRQALFGSESAAAPLRDVVDVCLARVALRCLERQRRRGDCPDADAIARRVLDYLDRREGRQP